MPHFSPSGHDVVICQICARLLDTGKEEPTWRTDVTGSVSAGNVCASCVEQHDKCKLTGEALREYVRRGGVDLRGTVALTREKAPFLTTGPIGLEEHCRRESGLEGAALQRYINRHYGHG